MMFFVLRGFKRVTIFTLHKENFSEHWDRDKTFFYLPMKVSRSRKTEKLLKSELGTVGFVIANKRPWNWNLSHCVFFSSARILASGHMLLTHNSQQQYRGRSAFVESKEFSFRVKSAMMQKLILKINLHILFSGKKAMKWKTSNNEKRYRHATNQQPSSRTIKQWNDWTF